MTTLYLNVPLEKVGNAGKRSFEDTLKTAIGNGYAIPKDDAERLLPGCKVVLLCQDRKQRQRAEGKLEELKHTGEKTKSGMLRYDVHIKSLTEVPYVPPPMRLRRTGILVIAVGNEGM